MSANIKVGDRVVVESPIYHFYDASLSLRGSGECFQWDDGLGLYGVVTDYDGDGDAEIEFDNGRRDYVSPEGLLRVDDLDRLAEERKPKRVHGYVVGSKVQLYNHFDWYDDQGELHFEHVVDGHYCDETGEMLTVLDLPTTHHKKNLMVESSLAAFEVTPKNVCWSEYPPEIEAEGTLSSDEALADLRARLSGEGICYEAAMDEVRIINESGAAKGSKLARFDLIPTDALWELAEHYGKGSAKYDVQLGEIDNWRRGFNHSLSYAALMRHAVLALGGEDIDPETGSKHLIAVAWHALALTHYLNTGLGQDDRQALIERQEDVQA